MATVIGNNLPPLPPGFVLGDAQTAPQLPALPEGFVVGEPKQEAPQEPLTLADRIAQSLSGAARVIPPVQMAIDQAKQLPETITNINEQLQQRGANLADIFQAHQAGEQIGEETLLQTVGTEIGALGDILGQGIVSAAKSLPDAVKEPINEGVRSLLDTSAGQAGVEALGKGVREWESFKEENPRAARNIEAGFNVATFALPIKGTSAAKITGRGVKSGARLVGKIGADVSDDVVQAARSAGETLVKVPVVTSDDIVSLSAKAYKKADDLGGSLKPQFRDKFIDDISKILPKEERITSGKDVIDDVLETMGQRRGEPITLRGAQEIDEQLGGLIDKEFGLKGLSKEGRTLQNIQTTFREGVEGATPAMVSGGNEGFAALKEGRKLWSASRRLKDVERILERAELIDNPATAIKTGFRNLVTNPKKVRGFSKKEVALMKKAAKTGVVSDLFRVTLGSRLIPIVTAGAGGGLGSSALAAGASIASRGAAERVVAGRAAAVTREIARRAMQGQ